MWKFKKIKKNPKKVIFSVYKEFLAENDVFWKSNLWRYVILLKTKKFRLDVTISKKKKKLKKIIFLAYGELLTEKHVFLKIETVEDMKFW